jgi:nucleoid-associated protein YgaU
MERRIKLTMAAVALGLLVAGAVRRWAKETGFDLLRDQQEAEVVSTSHEAEYDARPAAAWTSNEHSAVAPVAAEFPVASGRRPAEAASAPGYATPPQTSFIPAAPPNNVAADSPPFDDPASAPISSPSATASAARPNFYVTEPNDSFWTISQRVYGTGRYFQALYEHNRRLCPQPDRLPRGVTIETPEPHVLERAYPDLFR